MATVNERFSDALLRRQFQLILYGNGVTNDINALLDSTEARVRELLRSRLASIVARGYDTGPDTTSRLRLLQQAISDIRSKGFQQAQRLWSRQLQQVVREEAGFVDRAFMQISPVVVDTVLPNVVTLAAAVVEQPILGAVLDDWVSTMTETDTARIMQGVQQGLVLGEDMDKIARRVFGTRSMSGADGMVELSRRDAANFSRTAVMSLTNQARGAYFQANNDVFEEEQYVATLDSKTTPLCRSLDGNRYRVGEGPIPGRDTHWNCRSVRVAVIVGELLGDRPAAAWSEDMLAGLDREERRAKIRELTGRVPASTTYEQWLKRQAPEFQDSVLGPTRAERYRAGQVTLKNFVDSSTGKAWTLQQLREAEPTTWAE